jgi:hypothetical protein
MQLFAAQPWNPTLPADLSPPLRADIEQLRFSPDGKYLLAQDESSIYVLTRQPFAVKFPSPLRPHGKSECLRARSLRRRPYGRRGEVMPS